VQNVGRYLTGVGIGDNEKNMTAEELDLVYAAEKERYRSVGGCYKLNAVDPYS
jgi:hypothetical protein